MSIGKDKGDLVASLDRGEGEAGLHLIQADAQILELEERIIRYGKIYFFPIFPIFFHILIYGEIQYNSILDYYFTFRA